VSIRSLRGRLPSKLTMKDALAAHARDELGISAATAARPVQAAMTSAASFSMPLLMVVVSPAGALVPIVSGASLVFLALLGAVGARAGGANVMHATARVSACHGSDGRYRDACRRGCLRAASIRPPVI
jgi:VIT1/CCC1 family predicted Fe2+/Mn2+ transporter